ncbi:LacI family DNA-binding transcriptional regulator [Euzebya sp.]|uniref:LacI family DNA-binding transcriptional regulator n=1 Tax=Euzebya sp. TaxID=1971409 RepID=UPI00351759E2
MTASISDVAARAGVSVATVSRALRGLPNVAERTRDRVLAAAAELDYVVNPNASRLAAGHNLTVGVVLPHTTGWYFQHVLSGVQAVLHAQGYDMLLYTLPDPEARERFLALLPFRKRVDGLVLIDIPLTDVEQRLLAGLGTPLVAVGEGGPHFPHIEVDNTHGAQLATEFLLDLGHRRVGLISGPLDDPMRFRVANDRWAGWAAALEARGIDPDGDWVAIGDFRMEHGLRAMAHLLARAPGLTAVLCMSDEMAIGAMRLLSEQRIGVPEDISVVGFDGHEIGAYIGLTTVAQPMEVLGAGAADVLLAAIRGQRPTGFPRVVPLALVVRETTAPPVRTGLAARRIG